MKNVFSRLGEQSATWLPALVLAVGTAAALGSTWWLHSRSQAEAEANFQRLVLRDSAEISTRFRKPVYGLNGARGVYATHATVQRDTFRRYVGSRNLPLEFPGVRGFGFIQQVPRAELAAFVATERADDAPQFAVRQLSPKDEADHYVIKFIEPAAANAGALGLDVGSEAVRRRGLLDALETGEATVSGVITLVQDQRSSPGMLLYVPVYRAAAGGETPAGPGAELRGLLYAPIVLDELLDGLRDAGGDQLRIELFDTASGTSQGTPMYDTHAVLATSQAGNLAAANASSVRFEMMRTVDLPGRTVTLRASSTPAFEAAHAGFLPWLVGFGVASVSWLLALLLRQQMRSRSRAERLARDMTADLNRLAVVARRTTNAVVITNAERRITWVNESFEQITGYTAAEAMGQSPGALLQTEQTDPATIQALREALNARQGFNGEILNRSKTGRVYWLELDIQPLHDKAGRFTGFMAVELDITERKNAEHATARQQRSLQNIIEGTEVGTWEWNVDTGETSFNERWAQIIGYTLAELVPTSTETWSRFAHAEDLRQSTLLLKRHFDGLSESYECESRMRHKDGHWVWVLIRGKLFSRSDDGRPRWMAGTQMDITERKRSEATLRASQAFLSQTGRIGGVGGWTMDIATQQLAWTDETCRIHDQPPGHQPKLDEGVAYYVEEARPVIQAAVQHSVATGEGFDLELQMITAKGRAIWVRAVGEAEFADGQAVRLVGAVQDITARREMAAALERNNLLLESVLENLPCGLLVIDAELHLVLANREFAGLLTLPPHLVQPGTTHFEQMIRFNAERGDYGVLQGEALEAQVQTIVNRARGPVQPHQFERAGPGGKTLEVRGGPLPGGGFITTYTDISARRLAEEEARRSAELLRGAIDAIDEAFVLYDPQDRLVMCNEPYRRLYAGVAHLMVPGVPFETLVRTGAERGDYAQAIGRVDEWVAERMAAHFASNFAHVQLLSDGRTLRIVERKLPDGHTVGFRIDITELTEARQKAEQATLAASRALARLQAIYNILPMGITLTDPQGHIIDCNPASERLLGISKAEHLARDYAGAEWTILREDGTPMPSEEFASVRALKHGMAVHGAVMQVVTPQHSVWLSVDAVPVLHDELGVVVAYADMTEQRAQLQALMDAKSQAEMASVAKSQFLANMSHEIRTPMNAILGMLALLKRTELSARQADYTGKTEGAARSLLGLLNDILDFSKVEAGKMTLDPQPFRMDQLMRDLGVILSANAGDKPVEVLFDIDPALPRSLVGDAMRLQQVLINLGGNAIKFTERGEVVVAVRVLAQLGDTVTLQVSVRDTGIGIAPENQARIFSGFTQAEASTTRRFGGTGLGVAISQRLVAMMGGALELDSVLGQGTTFHFSLTLPLAAGRADALESAPNDLSLVHPVRRVLVADDNATARELLAESGASMLPTQGPRSTAAQRLAGMRLLVVEDNLNNQQVARELLEDEGALVQIAGNGLEGVQAVAAADPPFDLVLMDLQMPVMDGFSATAHIRTELGRITLPIVAMTANAMASDREACLAAGMNEHVGKPFDLDHLVATLLRCTGRASGPKLTGATPASDLPPELLEEALHRGIDLAAALTRLGGKRTVYQRSLRSFAKDLVALPEQLEGLLQQGQTADACRLAHTIKGVAATLGLKPLAEAAARAEAGLLTPHTAPQQGALTDALRVATQSALQAASYLEDALAQATQLPVASAPAGAGNTAELRQTLDELVALLDAADMRAVDVFEKLQQAYVGALHNALQPLGDAIAELDFERALSLCQPFLSESHL
jgi:PAS domain S-box-containing protein